MKTVALTFVYMVIGAFVGNRIAVIEDAIRRKIKLKKEIKNFEQSPESWKNP